MSERRRPRCKKHVFSGARHDVGGHQCGNLAAQGSAFCHLHHGQPVVPPQDTDALAEPAVTSAQSTKYVAALDWAPGLGPIVQPPYYRGLGFVTRTMATRTDDRPPTVTLQGYLMKKDGTPGRQRWDATFGAEDVLPGRYLRQLLDALEKEGNR
jgi:hypothetical protein